MIMIEIIRTFLRPVGPAKPAHPSSIASVLVHPYLDIPEAVEGTYD